jgi:hypothetical protein
MQSTTVRSLLVSSIKVHGGSSQSGGAPRLSMGISGSCDGV